MKDTQAAALPLTNVRPRPKRTAREAMAHRFYVASAVFDLAATAIAVAALLGWWLQAPVLKGGVGGTTMKANTALALLFTGAGLWLYRIRAFSHERDRAIKILTGAAALIAFATTIEHLTGWSLHIDQLLVQDDTMTAGVPGRMALATATCLMLVNAAVLVADTPGRYVISQMFIGTAIFVATLNTVGYIFGLDAFSGIASYSAMGMHTSGAIFFSCLAFLFARPDDGLMRAVTETDAGGLTIRQLLPVVFVLPVLLAWISWQGVRFGLFEASFAMAIFVALTTNVLSYAVWGGGLLLRGFDQKRRTAEADRLQSEERLRRAVSEAPAPMIIHDNAGTILHMSRGWSDYSGYSLEEIPAIATWMATSKPVGAEPIHHYFDRIARANETVAGGEWVIQTRSGESRIWELSTTPVGKIGSGSQAFVTTALDVTERKRAEADLRQANESLEQRIGARTGELTQANDALKRQSDQLKEQATLLDLVRDGILVRDLYGTIVYWNAGATDMYGWKANEVLGTVSHALTRPEYGRPIADIEKQVLQAGFWEGEGLHTTKSGARIPVESRWTLTRNDRGIPEGFLEVNRDISARRQAQDSLKDSELRFRAVSETAIEGILSMDEAGTIRYWNPGAERLFGRKASDAVGQPVAVALPEKPVSDYAHAGGTPTAGSTFETTGLRKDGSSFPVELSLAAWANSQGSRFVTGIARDITQRKSAERALEAKADELARSNQELEQFAYVASHDLQEPLRMVSNYTQLLGRRYKDKLDADANEFIGFAVDGAKRMQDLIHDLLEYARVGTRGKEFKPIAVDQVLSDVLANLSGAIEEAHAEIKVGTLPTLACDASQLAQVFQNLVGNAIKFRRAGSKPVVTVSAARGNGRWTFAVKDNGIGIEPKYFERIFQMFQRLHGRSDYPGTGIGLALCKKIVERHNGRMRVESEPGKGTTFSFAIPEGLDRV